MSSLSKLRKKRCVPVDVVTIGRLGRGKSRILQRLEGQAARDYALLLEQGWNYSDALDTVCDLHGQEPEQAVEGS